MLTKTTMQEIQDLKLQGFTQAQIISHYKNLGIKPPSRPTIAKYYAMDVVPENPGEKLAKDKAFDEEPFRSAILRILESNEDKDYCMSSVYDVLEELFIESGQFDSLPGNEQTLRNYIHHLEESGQITRDPDRKRVYNHVFDTPPGDQMLIDFGVQTLSKNQAIHFICLLLRYSRFLVVYAQDHKYSAEEACTAIYMAFCRLGGRVRQLVIDQDAVFISSETYGEVIKTRVFEDFCTEQELSLYVCRKADPESKGPIENSVGFVKKNFFSARDITCIDDVWRSLPGWLQRKNKRIHQATYCVPVAVFETAEKQALSPLLPSVYDKTGCNLKDYEIGSMPYLTYKASKYSVPQSCAYSVVKYMVTGGKIHIFDENRKFICSHNLSEVRGSFNQLPEHRKAEGGSYIEVMEKLRNKWNCYDFQHFINGVKKENPRYVADQLRAIDRYLDEQAPTKTFVAMVMKECCEHYRYRFGQFQAVFEALKAESAAKGEESAAYPHTGVEYKGMDVYTKAFQDRVVKAGVETA